MTRRFRKSIGLQQEEPRKKENLAFMIEAFHSVTRQLKEKERELERLKAVAEQRAENVESYNENILQCVTSGVVTFDINGRVMTVNRAAREMLGISQEQAAAGTCSEIFENGAICSAVQEAIQQKVPSVRSETPIDRPSGRIWLGYNTTVLSDRHGTALGVILAFSDLTEVKRLQEQVELRERLTALGEMSAGIAHELRNPMAVITGYLSLVSKKTGPSEQKIIRDVINEINGMNRIIDDLLTFARPASLNRVPVKVKELLEGCIENTMQAKNTGNRIVKDVVLEDFHIPADEVLMRQAFSNLIQNALEAMSGAGTLTVRSSTAYNEAVITICDTGAGIPEDKLKKIFLPFFTTKDTGVGMGLALAHKVVTSHGGRIDVESKKDKGSRFRVFLPAR
jgi:PAS domain S-box-containing protein